MFWEILIAIVIGVNAGIITGLIPGIHVNLVGVLILSVSSFFLVYVSPLVLACFIIALAITHSFLDSIPGVFLGAPDSSQSLNVLPGHRLLLQGLGHNAVVYTVIGSLGSLLLGLALFPLFVFFMRFVHPFLSSYIGYLLVLIMLFMILKEKSLRKILYSFLMFLTAGILGIVVLDLPGIDQPLFPLLSGLFGISILLTSLFDKAEVPVQKSAPLSLSERNTFRAVSASTFMGLVAGFLPGFGSGQAAVVASQFVGKIGDEGFLCLVGGINTANMLVSIGTAYALDKARNGAIVVVKDLIGSVSFSDLFLFLFLALIVGGIASVLALFFSRRFAVLISKFDYAKIIVSIMLFVTILTFIFDGLAGLLILFVSSAVGLLASQLGVGKNFLMGCLIVPVIFFFIL